MIVELLGKKDKRAKCTCDYCGNTVVKYLSQLTNMTYQFCNQKCSTSAKKKGEIIDQQTRARNAATHGVDHHLKRPDVKLRRFETNVQRYGVRNQFQRPEVISAIADIVQGRTLSERVAIHEKIKATCQQRYGVDHPSQVLAVHERSIRNVGRSHAHGHINTPWAMMWYRSSWELLFLQWCIIHAQHVQPNVCIPYLYKGIQHVYFADFLVAVPVGSFLCEVKPDKLAMQPQNQAKFVAGAAWARAHNATFVHINEAALKDLNLVFKRETVGT